MSFHENPAVTGIAAFIVAIGFLLIGHHIAEPYGVIVQGVCYALGLAVAVAWNYLQLQPKESEYE